MDGAVASEAAPLLLAEAARPLLDGLSSDAAFDARSAGRLLFIAGASSALRALLFGPEAVAETAGRHCRARLTGRLELAGRTVANGEHARHFGMASYAAPLPPNLSLRDYLSSGARLRGAGSGAALLADATLERWRLTGLARRRLGLFNRAEKRLATLAFATVSNPRGLILERPFDGLSPEQTDVLSAGLALVAEHNDMILLSPTLRADGAYAAWAQRSATVLVFRAGRLLLQQSGASLWQAPQRIEVEVVGTADAFCERLRAAGASVAESGRALLVTLPEGADMQLLLREAVASDTALLRCAPLLVGP